MWCGFVVDFLEPIGVVLGEGGVAGLGSTYGNV